MDEKDVKCLGGGFKPRLIDHSLAAERAVVVFALACCLIFVDSAFAGGSSPSSSEPSESRVVTQIGGGLRATTSGKDGQFLGDGVNGRVELDALVSANGEAASHVRQEKPADKRRERNEQGAFNQFAKHAFISCLFIALGWLCAKTLISQGEEREWLRAHREWRKKWCEDHGRPFV
jgi:hypothetical protein